MTLPILIVFGDKTANEVLETAQLASGKCFSRIEKVYFEPQSFSSEILPALQASDGEIYYTIGVANVAVKQAIRDRCAALDWKPFSVVHPTAVVAPSARLGQGAFIGPLAVISSNAMIGDHSIIHIHASVGHDVVIGEFCAVLPGARISGLAQLEDRVLIGSNAFVAAGVRLQHDSQVDALTYVRQELAAGHIASVRSKRPVKRPGF
ncbi:LbetaH domain-containing protein [Aureliella helgolandensis]|uniref:UDP-N-acetylbacillosamine N-acetyltransferase n=1 Tax=Aureliella helgolandensis TaxID=2527968 RepID=A0A518GC66_9BACT|nr:hypothetical protein [Aureliella helgolandensis]QDV26140.1 UDP-N-acetylbacillosamine N-acetyltransferase [Aureliella helgolandensis]